MAPSARDFAPKHSTMRRKPPYYFLSFIVSLSFLFYIQIGKLNFTSYVQHFDVNDGQSFSEDGGAWSPIPGEKLTERPLEPRRFAEDGGAWSPGTGKKLTERPSEPRGRRTRRLDDKLMIKAKDQVDRSSKLLSEIPKTAQLQSPACHPHFQSVSSNTSWTWSNTTKFQRMYFYHNRKAGGTSLAYYFAKVARHHGLEFEHKEFLEAEEPGMGAVPTFYITHLREPIDRALSHFKYQGRWSCKDLSRMRHGDDVFVPTEENAKGLASWKETGGHNATECNKSSKGLYLGECAVNCYTQWVSGLSCPQYNVSTRDQYQVAKAKLLRYNFIVVLERLKDPAYAAAVENFFGVPGVQIKRHAFCEPTSKRANRLFPLHVGNRTLSRLIRRNRADLRLHGELTECLDENGGRYEFPAWDPSRFEATSVKVPYYEYDEWKKVNGTRRKRTRGNEAQSRVITIGDQSKNGAHGL